MARTPNNSKHPALRQRLEEGLMELGPEKIPGWGHLNMKEKQFLVMFQLGGESGETALAMGLNRRWPEHRRYLNKNFKIAEIAVKEMGVEAVKVLLKDFAVMAAMRLGEMLEPEYKDKRLTYSSAVTILKAAGFLNEVAVQDNRSYMKTGDVTLFAGADRKKPKIVETQVRDD